MKLLTDIEYGVLNEDMKAQTWNTRARMETAVVFSTCYKAERKTVAWNALIHRI